ncbi:MAG TPA: ABC transporter ATP-binding protein [Polyangiaceae bacterium]|nr:ABC transporter ATP-binding protein [Polyangiaceae bacterium]
MVPLLSTLTGTAQASSTSGRWLARVIGTGNPSSRLALFAATILGVVILKGAISYAAAWVAGSLRRGAMVELRRQLLDRVLYATPERIEAHTSGEISGAFLTDATHVAYAIDFGVLTAQRTLIAGSYFVALVWLSPTLSFVTFALALILGTVALALNRHTARRGRATAAANADLASHVSETVGGLRLLRTTATETIRAQSFETVNTRQATCDINTALGHSLTIGVTESLGVAGAMGLTTAAYVFGVSSGRLEASLFLAFGFGLLRLLPALNQIYGLQGSFAALAGSIEQVMKWLDLPKYPKRPFGARSLDDVGEAIEFRDVTFAYPNGQLAADRLSFRVPTGAFVAVVGASGAGKSTLAGLLLRLREPTAGLITLGNTDYWEFSRSSFHRAVACVEQESFLFKASIFENLTLGSSEISRELAWTALESVQLGDFVKQLPQGLDTVLAERGASLSGGQRQRLTIARAILRAPKVLVLDEPTSALDADTEREVLKAIQSASVGRTTFMITHRNLANATATHKLVLPQGILEELTHPKEHLEAFPGRDVQPELAT